MYSILKHMSVLVFFFNQIIQDHSEYQNCSQARSGNAWPENVYGKSEIKMKNFSSTLNTFTDVMASSDLSSRTDC